MNHYLIMISILLLNTSCYHNNNSKSDDNPLRSDNLKANNPDSTFIDSVEKFYEFDTILINEYNSKNGHKIRTEGSKSGDIYRITVTSNRGYTKSFKTANSWYIAAHSSIKWDNDDFIFVDYGCGTYCKGGLALSLKDDRGIIDFQDYIYVKSDKNIIIYPDSSTVNTLQIENIKSQNRHSLLLDICDNYIFPFQAIDTVHIESDTMFISYLSSDCNSPTFDTISLKSINLL